MIMSQKLVTVKGDAERHEAGTVCYERGGGEAIVVFINLHDIDFLLAGRD